MKILGLSAFHHDSAATRLDEQKIVAPAQQEPFSRKKDDGSSRYAPGVRLGYPRLVEALPRVTRSGVAAFDLWSLFDQDPRPLYRDDCCHYNLEDNRLLAEAIVSRIPPPRWVR